MILYERISIHFKCFFAIRLVYVNVSIWEVQYKFYVRGSVCILDYSIWEDQYTLWMILYKRISIQFKWFYREDQYMYFDWFYVRGSIHFEWFYVRGSVYTLNDSMWGDQYILWMILWEMISIHFECSMWGDQFTLEWSYGRGSVYTLNDSIGEDQYILWMMLF